MTKMCASDNIDLQMLLVRSIRQSKSLQNWPSTHVRHSVSISQGAQKSLVSVNGHRNVWYACKCPRRQHQVKMGVSQTQMVRIKEKSGLELWYERRALNLYNYRLRPKMPHLLQPVTVQNYTQLALPWNSGQLIKLSNVHTVIKIE